MHTTEVKTMAEQLTADIDLRLRKEDAVFEETHIFHTYPEEEPWNVVLHANSAGTNLRVDPHYMAYGISASVETNEGALVKGGAQDEQWWAKRKGDQIDSKAHAERLGRDVLAFALGTLYREAEIDENPAEIDLGEALPRVREYLTTTKAIPEPVYDSESERAERSRRLSERYVNAAKQIVPRCGIYVMHKSTEQVWLPTVFSDERVGLAAHAVSERFAKRSPASTVYTVNYETTGTMTNKDRTLLAWGCKQLILASGESAKVVTLEGEMIVAGAIPQDVPVSAYLAAEDRRVISTRLATPDDMAEFRTYVPPAQD